MTTLTSPPASLADALRVRSGVATLDASWSSWAGPHGGLVAGLALQHARSLVGDRAPRSLDAHFLAPASPGDVRLRGRLVREGGASAVAAVEVSGPGGVVATATLVAGRARGPAPAWDGPAAPPVPPPDACPEWPGAVDLVPFSQHFRFHPADGRTPGGGHPTPELVAWVRPVAPVPLDAAALVVLLDVLPPALYATATAPVPVPTVELTATLTGQPCDDPWVLCRIATRHAGEGWCVDDSEVWSADGRLLAEARQTRRVLGELR
jgi:acyl-CoA thioesterase